MADDLVCFPIVDALYTLRRPSTTGGNLWNSTRTGD